MLTIVKNTITNLVYDKTTENDGYEGYLNLRKCVCETILPKFTRKLKISPVYANTNHYFIKM